MTPLPPFNEGYIEQGGKVVDKLQNPKFEAEGIVIIVLRPVALPLSYLCRHFIIDLEKGPMPEAPCLMKIDLASSCL